MNLPLKRLASSRIPVTAVVLAGGQGTRVRAALGALPKGAAQVGGQPFIELLTSYLLRVGVNAVVVLAGYRAEVLVQLFNHPKWEAKPVNVVRGDQLGTGGDLLTWLGEFPGSRILLANADTVLEMDIWAMVSQHISRRTAECTIAVSRRRRVQNEGALVIGKNGLVRHSHEGRRKKGGGTRSEGAWRASSTGVYLIERAALVGLAREEYVSLEKDVVPYLIDRGSTFAYDCGRTLFLDFGTPQGLRQLAELEDEVLRIYGTAARGPDRCLS
jgi:D-glycero-alpha-D-manno-heptose 1-phosphate guanylyltransferase